MATPISNPSISQDEPIEARNDLDEHTGRESTPLSPFIGTHEQILTRGMNRPEVETDGPKTEPESLKGQIDKLRVEISRFQGQVNKIKRKRSKAVDSESYKVDGKLFLQTQRLVAEFSELSDEALLRPSSRYIAQLLVDTLSFYFPEVSKSLYGQSDNEEEDEVQQGQSNPSLSTARATAKGQIRDSKGRTISRTL